MAERVSTDPQSTYQAPPDEAFGVTDVQPHDGQPSTPAYRPDLTGYGDTGYGDTGYGDYNQAGS
jgi:hypothetical protein